MKGVFITLEGPEGSGKTTQAARLCERLRELGLEVVSVREPGGTRTGEAIRKIVQHDSACEPIFPETEALLFAASRAQLVRAEILPALARGAWVVSDRFADSTTAYQGYGRGFEIDTILGINAFAIGDAVPRLTFLLNVDLKTGFLRLGRRNRAANRRHDRIERENLAFHERVRRGYLRMARRWPRRFRVIDSRRSADAVHEDIWQHVSRLRDSHKSDRNGARPSGRPRRLPVLNSERTTSVSSAGVLQRADARRPEAARRRKRGQGRDD